MAAALREWEAVRERPEFLCATAWSSACRAWWSDATDSRLRSRTKDTLYLDEHELDAWLGEGLERAAFLRAHEHVCAMRAGVERELGRRVLSTGSLRSVPVVVVRGDGTRKTFMPESEVPASLERVRSDFELLPQHPFLRAAWLHDALVAIHPFRDANGGSARFAASLELARAGLPPFELSLAQRNGPYPEALDRADQHAELAPLVLVVSDAVQQGLAAALERGAFGPTGASWKEPARTRARRWAASLARKWTARAGEALDATASMLDAAKPSELAGLVERSGRTGRCPPLAPSPVAWLWTARASTPLHLDFSVSVEHAGGTTWTLAHVAGTVGTRGMLGEAGHPEAVPSVFVAPENEPDGVVDARFERWSDARLEECAQGFARWM